MRLCHLAVGGESIFAIQSHYWQPVKLYKSLTVATAGQGWMVHLAV